MSVFVCGIDIGLNNVGWALLDIGTKEAYRCGTWEFLNADFERRLNDMQIKLMSFSESYWDTVMFGVEDVWVGPNQKYSIQLAKIWGVTFASVYHPCVPIAPSTAKRALTGNGNATKERVMTVASDIIKVDSQHAADALAVAYGTWNVYMETDGNFQRRCKSSFQTVTGYSWNVPIWSFSNT